MGFGGYGTYGGYGMYGSFGGNSDYRDADDYGRNFNLSERFITEGIKWANQNSAGGGDGFHTTLMSSFGIFPEEETASSDFSDFSDFSSTSDFSSFSGFSDEDEDTPRLEPWRADFRYPQYTAGIPNMPLAATATIQDSDPDAPPFGYNPWRRFQEQYPPNPRAFGQFGMSGLGSFPAPQSQFGLGFSG